MKHLKLILKTLISNNACVEAARTKEKKYNIIGPILGILSLVLAVVPSLVNGFKKNGSDWINGTTKYDADTGIYMMSDAIINKNGPTFIIKDSGNGTGILEVEQQKWNQNFPTPDNKEYCVENEQANYYQLNPYIYKRPSAARSLEVYVRTDIENDAEFDLFCSQILNNINPNITSNTDSDKYLYYTIDTEGKKIIQPRTTSVMFFGRKHFYAYMFKPDTSQPVSSVGGDYNHLIENGEDIISKYFVKNEPTKDGISETLNNWKVFFDKVYIDTRARSTWTSVGIMFGVDAGVLLFMGLMVWILTRGKNNPFRIYTIWDGQKIAYYASFTPGILALILGFILSQMSLMFYILLIGVRVMWLSMKTLKPTN